MPAIRLHGLGAATNVFPANVNVTINGGLTFSRSRFPSATSTWAPAQ